MTEQVPILTPRRIPGRSMNTEAGVEDVTPASPSASWWHVLSAPGEVSLRLRRRRVAQAMAFGVAAWLSALLGVGVLVWPSEVEAEAAREVLADEASGTEGGVSEVRYRVRPRPATAEVTVRSSGAAAPARRGPGDVLLALPTDRKLQLFSWTLSCEGGAKPPVSTGRIEEGTPALRIPMVPPVPCDLTFTGGAVQVRVTAGARLECLWQGQLICR